MKRFALSLLLFAFSRPAALPAQPDCAAVEKHALELFQNYVRIASVNPPADTRATAELLKKEFDNAGLEAKLLESGTNHLNLLVRLPGRDRSKKPLLLLNHMDVVPVAAKQWKVEPFSASIQDGSIWGRGTLDMKSTGVMELTSLLLL